MNADAPTRLARRLGLGDAVVIGLGSMIGAGVFAAIGPAAQAAGTLLLVGLLLAAVVAFCNATSSAQLAALYPESGGTYVYANRRLGWLWGWTAGWCFVVGKIASCAVMAMTFATYAAPGLVRPLAVAAVVGVTTVDLFGVRKTALATKVIVAIVLATLAAVVVAGLTVGDPSPANLRLGGSGGPRGVLQSAGLLFFAFAGYARIATLGEEVVDPAVTIPRAIPLALAMTLGVYALVATTALLTLGPDRLAQAQAPLAEVGAAAGTTGAAVVVRVGAAVASLGVLLSLLAGVSRTTFAMAANGDLPRPLAAVSANHGVPRVAGLVASALIVGLVLLTDLRSAIGFSSFAVLIYYGLANASAWTLSRAERRWPRWVSGVGLIGCGVVAASLPLGSVAAGIWVVGAGVLVAVVRRVL